MGGNHNLGSWGMGRKEIRAASSHQPGLPVGNSSTEPGCVEAWRNQFSLPILSQPPGGCCLGCGNNPASTSGLDPVQPYKPVWSRAEPGASASRGVERTRSQGNKLFRCLPPSDPGSIPAKLLSPRGAQRCRGTCFCLCCPCLSRMGGYKEREAGDIGDPQSQVPAVPAASAVAVALPALPRGAAGAGWEVVLLVQHRACVIASSLGGQPADLPALGGDYAF